MYTDYRCLQLTYNFTEQDRTLHKYLTEISTNIMKEMGAKTVVPSSPITNYDIVGIKRRIIRVERLWEQARMIALLILTYNIGMRRICSLLVQETLPITVAIIRQEQLGHSRIGLRKELLNTVKLVDHEFEFEHKDDIVLKGGESHGV